MAPLTLNELLMNLKKRDLYDLLLFLTWYADSNRPSCIDCIKAKSQFSKKMPNCHSCLPIRTQIKKYFSGKGESDEENK